MHQPVPMGRVSVDDMARAREERAEKQRAMLAQGGTLVCLTMNVPGPVKVTPLIYEAFDEGVRLIEQTAGEPRRTEIIEQKTGLEGYFVFDADAETLKRALCAVEDETPLGRLFDIDVLNGGGEKLSRETFGMPARTCLLCGRPAFVCARSRAHSVDELNAEIERLIIAFKKERTVSALSSLCVDSLILEAETTPKPGLVDKRNVGSHPDMTMELLIKSARALKGYFAACAALGFDTDDPRAIFSPLQREGLRAEQTMLKATGGVNTHKGAIFSLGILCAAAAHGERRGNCPDPRSVCGVAQSIVRKAVFNYFSSLDESKAKSFGEKLYVSSRVRGIRGEAADGFPAVLDTALPALDRYAPLYPSFCGAGARALICLLGRVKDTTLIKRGGAERAEEIGRLARDMVARGDLSDEALIRLDELFIAENLTCGGCADLLSCAYFLYNFERTISKKSSMKRVK